MLRYLILALVVVFVVWWLLGRSRKRPGSGRAASDKQTPLSFAVCAHCGVHLPTNEAVLDGQRADCSESHRLAGPRERG